ncbi:hypothetical protein AAVH_12939 [Aphelenchoides avenae]|nr:hypothetical protein AAVH_12939 [Aphelenchus avenae]
MIAYESSTVYFAWGNVKKAPSSNDDFWHSIDTKIVLALGTVINFALPKQPKKSLVVGYWRLKPSMAPSWP